MAFLALGDLVAGTILQTGRFRHEDAVYVWGILAGSAVGLLASTFARLCSSTYWALGDTKTPLRYAIVRVALTAALGFVAAVYLPGWIGIEARWGAAGLTASAGAGRVGGVLPAEENARAAHRLRSTLPPRLLPRLWGAAAVAAALAFGVKLAAPPMSPILLGGLTLGPYCLIYLGLTLALGIPQARGLLRRAGIGR